MRRLLGAELRRSGSLCDGAAEPASPETSVLLSTVE
jgi:hypothetical protein